MKILLIIFGFLSALTAYAAVDIRVKKEIETRMQTGAGFSQNELVDLNLAFTDAEIVNTKTGLGLSDAEDRVMTQVLKNEGLVASDIHDFVLAFNKQLKGKTFTSGERKYLLGITGENKKAEDRMKFLARRKLKE